jgi:hypothetical protein
MVSTTWPASPARQRRPVPSPARAKAGHRGRHPCRRRMLTPQRGFGPGAGEGSPRSRCPILCPVAACRDWVAPGVEELKPAFLLTKPDRHKSRESIDSWFEWNLESAGRKGLLGGRSPLYQGSWKSEEQTWQSSPRLLPIFGVIPRCRISSNLRAHRRWLLPLCPEPVRGLVRLRQDWPGW